jgi:DNA polymerase-3 subunit delta'
VELKSRQPRIPASLGSFIGNAQAIHLLRRAIEQDRLPHAMIFAGPAGVGKCTLAVLLAQQLNCLSLKSGGACGECVACRKTLAVLESRYLACLTPRGEIPCGGCASCRTLSNQHPDVRIVKPLRDKSTISMDQVRDLIAEISYQPFDGRYRVVILDPVDQMAPRAPNVLLKTLEEPASRTIIILVTTKPFELLTTIRSRSRMLQFSGIPQHQIEEFLVRRAGRPLDEARMSAVLSRGSLAAALDFDGELYQELREKALRFVSLLLTKGSFHEASSIATFVVKYKKDKEAFTIWLESVEALLQDVYFAHFAPARMIQSDLRAELEKLTRASSRREVVSAIEAIKSLRLSLQRNVQRQLAVEALFLSLAGGAPREPGTQGR